MREVPAKIFGFIRHSCLELGLDVEAAAAGTRLASVDTDRFGERVDWDDLARFINVAFAHFDLEQLYCVGERYVPSNLWLCLVARTVATPRLLHRLVWPMSRPAFRHMRFVCEPRQDSYHLEMWLPRRYVGCPGFFHVTVGEARVMGCLTGGRPARVEADVGTHHGIYEIHFADPPTLLDRVIAANGYRLERLATESLRLLDFSMLADSSAAVSAPLDAEALCRNYGLSAAEARVAVCLAQGQRLPEISEHLEIAMSTVRSHLKSAYAKTGARGQAELVRLVLCG